jgi:enoyl-[acyl-carrier protein] reductase II
MEAAVPLTGQVCGRIEAVKTVSQILQETINGFREVVTGMGRYTS